MLQLAWKSTRSIIYFAYLPNFGKGLDKNYLTSIYRKEMTTMRRKVSLRIYLWIHLLVAVFCTGKRVIFPSKVKLQHRCTMLNPATTDCFSTIKPVSICYAKQPQSDTEPDEKFLLFSPLKWVPIQLNIYRRFEDVDKVLGGSVLGYADTAPFNVTEPIGITFILTNFIYVWAGFVVLQNGAMIQALIIEAAGLLSVNYHWNQLIKGPNNNDVRIALVLDYFGAFLAISLILVETINQSVNDQVPVVAILFGTLGAFNLILSWIYANGAQYIFFHSLWHIFSGIASHELFIKSITNSQSW